MRRLALAAMVVVSLGLGAVLSACGGDSDGAPEPKLSAAGERGKVVAKEQGCISCHSTDGSSSVGPTWKGLAGSTVTLDGGKTVVADDDYLVESILFPRTVIVEDYPGQAMPIYDGELTDAQVADLLAYLHDLAPATPSASTTVAGSESGS